MINGWQTSQVADIKSLLVAGTNVIAIAGLNSSADASGIIAAAQVDTTRIVTDGTWKALPGTPASPPDGWNTASFDDSAWPAANVLGGYGISPWGTGVHGPVTAPAGVLRADLIPPVEQTATVKPVKVTDQPGVTVPVPVVLRDADRGLALEHRQRGQQRHRGHHLPAQDLHRHRPVHHLQRRPARQRRRRRDRLTSTGRWSPAHRATWTTAGRPPRSPTSSRCSSRVPT